MRSSISINLASEPFRRDRPVVVASIAGATLLLALLVYQVVLVRIRHGEAAEARAAVEQAARQLQATTAEQARLEEVLREPANAEALDYSVFLNGLLRRKGISWTRIFSDIEEILPHNVRLMSVRPQVNLDNQILLDMTVAAQSPEPVIQLYKNLEAAPQFGAIQPISSMPPSQSEPLFRYRVTARYAPEL